MSDQIPEDVIERAAAALHRSFAGGYTWRRMAGAALAASGLPARVAELEELCDQLAFVVNSYDEAGEARKQELRAEVIEAARQLAAVLNAKGAE